MRERLADALEAFAIRVSSPGRRRRMTRESGLLDLLIVGLVLAVVSIALSELLRPKPKFENARPAGLGDFQFPTATEGRPVPLVWGTVKISGPNVVWYGDLKQKKIKKKVKTGLFSSKNITTGYRYNIGFQAAWCRGPINALRRIWIGDRVVATPNTADGTVSIDLPKLFGGDELGSGGVSGTFRVHPGSEIQAKNSYLDGLLGLVPAYRGTAYGVWEGGYIGNSTSIKPWAFEVQRFPNQLGLTGGKEVVATWDANPAAVAYEILTDSDWGLGFDPSDIDVTNFRTAGDTLHTEANGFSMILDNVRDASEVLKEVERQIDGLVFLDQRTGLYKLKLARGGFDVNTIPQLDATNVRDVADFTRGTWEATSNQVHVEYVDRDKEYTTTYAQGHDLANMRIQEGEVTTAKMSFPGVKNRALATHLASREQRALSIPLARARVTVDRSMWELTPGDVVAWTDANFGFVKLPMRVNSVNLGNITEGKISLDLVQDVFQFAAAHDGQPPSTGWTYPNQGVVAIPANEQVVIEAPKAFTDRDDGVPDRLWAGARLKAGESFHNLYERNAAGVPAGAYRKVGVGSEFLLVGKLNATLSTGSANPVASLQLHPDFDTVADLFAAFTQDANAEDVGRNLVNLLYVDGEFMGARDAADSGTHVTLSNVYRGLLDTAPKTHLANTRVYLVFAGGNLSDETVPAGNNVHAIIRPESRDAELAEGSATQISLTMNNRARRPYPAAEMLINAARFPAAPDLDAGATLDTKGLLVAFTRRDFRTADEVASLFTDAATIDPSFPGVNTTEYRLTVVNDPTGTPATLFSTAWVNASSILARRNDILEALNGVIPTSLRIDVEARHTVSGAVWTAQVPLRWDFAPVASLITGDFNFGALDDGETSAVWTAPTTGTYGFTIGTALSTGVVEARINGGAWGTVIAAGATTGNLLGVVASDTIEVRHSQTGPGTADTFLSVDSPASGTDAYAILVI